MSVIEQSPADEPVLPGATLRRAREQAGIALEVVAQRTMIPLSRLRALESDDYERVGVATFVVGYLRAYAKFLKMDPVPLLVALEPSLPAAELAPMQTAPSVALALHVQKRPRSFFWPVVIVMVAVLGMVAFVGINTVLVPDDEVAPAPPERPVSDPVESSDSVLQQHPVADEVSPGEPWDPLVESLDEASTDQPDEISYGTENEVLRDTDFALTPTTQSAQTAAPAGQAEELDQPLPAVADTASDEVSLSFTEDCWVEVTDATGKALIARLATSEDNLRLFGQAPFQVVLGNAPAATVMFNGETIEAGPASGRKFKRLTVGESQ